MADLLDEYDTKTGHSVPIHGLFPIILTQLSILIHVFTVDGASGAFVAPFATVNTGLHPSKYFFNVLSSAAIALGLQDPKSRQY
jgi:glutamate/tyrosine decarboxylase-like PLP-dependent enzyme